MISSASLRMCGMMHDKPAACFYMGTFFAESLLLAETGQLIGTIQVAGTMEPTNFRFLSLHATTH